ncbi:MAG: helix-turn-helix transcriptional regulator, partial [Myxococcota bacterium]
GALPLGLPEAHSPELRRALGFARGNLRGARLTDAAQAAGVSPRTLARRVEEERGLSFRAWLRLLRLLEAAVLLEDEALRIGEVAARVGFESQSAFTHAFRALYAESPRAFRAGAPSRRRRRGELSR